MIRAHWNFGRMHYPYRVLEVRFLLKGGGNVNGKRCEIHVSTTTISSCALGEITLESVNLSILVLPERAAQFLLQNFSGTAFRERSLVKGNILRDFEFCEALATVRE